MESMHKMKIKAKSKPIFLKTKAYNLHDVMQMQTQRLTIDWQQQQQQHKPNGEKKKKKKKRHLK